MIILLEERIKIILKLLLFTYSTTDIFKNKMKIGNIYVNLCAGQLLPVHVERGPDLWPAARHSARHTLVQIVKQNLTVKFNVDANANANANANVSTEELTNAYISYCVVILEHAGENIGVNYILSIP